MALFPFSFSQAFGPDCGVNSSVTGPDGLRVKQIRILVYRLGSLGDTCIALPCFTLIRERWPAAQICLLTNVPVNAKAAPVVSVLENTDLCDDVIHYPLGMRSIAGIWRLSGEIKRHGFDEVINLTAERGRLKMLRDYFFFKLLCGIRRSHGFTWAKQDQAVVMDRNGNGEWEAVRLLRRVAHLGSVDLQSDRWWNLRLNSNERTVAREVLAAGGIGTGFVAVSVGTKVEAKDWGQENWEDLFRRLRTMIGDKSLIFVGTADEAPRSQRIAELWSGRVLNLCGKLSPRESAAILERAALFVGHDSGPMHLAATVGIPCVAIFAARNPPGQWFPRGERNRIFYNRTPCAGCGLDICIIHKKKCILSIQPEAVAQAIMCYMKADGGLKG